MQALPQGLLMDALKQAFPDGAEADLRAAAARSGGFLGQAKQMRSDGAQVPQQTRDLVEALCRRDALLLTQVLVPMEKWKRDALEEILRGWLEILEGALVTACGLEAVSPLARRLASSRESRDLHVLYETVKKARDYTLSNVSPGAVCGFLAWALR